MTSRLDELHKFSKHQLVAILLDAEAERDDLRQRFARCKAKNTALIYENQDLRRELDRAKAIIGRFMEKVTP